MSAIRLSSNEMRNILKNVEKQSITDKNDNDIMISKQKEIKMKNKLTDLNNHLFEQLERLNDEDLSEEQLEKEIKRSKAITSIATNIINNGNLILNSMKFVEDNGLAVDKDIDPTKLIGM